MLGRMLKPRWINIPPDSPDDPPPGPPDYVPEGRYVLEVEQIEEKQSQWGNEYYSLRCKVIDPFIHEDFRIYMILSTAQRALWRFGVFIEAVHGARPSGQFLFRPIDYLGVRFGADLTHATFNGKRHNQVGNLYFLR